VPLVDPESLDCHDAPAAHRQRWATGRARCEAQPRIAERRNETVVWVCIRMAPSDR